MNYTLPGPDHVVTLYSDAGVRRSDPDNEAVAIMLDKNLDGPDKFALAAIRQLTGTHVVTSTGAVSKLPSFEEGLKLLERLQEETLECVAKWETTDTSDWLWDEAFHCVDDAVVCGLRDVFVVCQWLITAADNHAEFEQYLALKDCGLVAVSALPHPLAKAMLWKLRPHPELLALYYGDDFT